MAELLEPLALAFKTMTPDGISRELTVSEIAAISSAVSLKRIADAMSETNEYGEGPAAAIGAGIARALRER